MSAWTAQPIFGVAITVIAYALAGAVHRRVAWLPMLVTTCALLIGFIVLSNIPLAEYRVGGDIVSFFLGPATITLGVPLYRQRAHIRRHLLAVLAGVGVGSAVNIAVAAACVKWSGGSMLLLRSMLPKGVTTPIAVELSRQVGGVPELSAVFAVLAGLLGSVVGPWLLRRAGVRTDLAIGLAMGTSSHGIGTARVVRDSQLQAGASGLAMGICGIVTSILIAILALLFRAA